MYIIATKHAATYSYIARCSKTVQYTSSTHTHTHTYAHMHTHTQFICMSLQMKKQSSIPHRQCTLIYNASIHVKDRENDITIQV